MTKLMYNEFHVINGSQRRMLSLIEVHCIIETSYVHLFRNKINSFSGRGTREEDPRSCDHPAEELERLDGPSEGHEVEGSVEDCNRLPSLRRPDLLKASRQDIQVSVSSLKSSQYPFNLISEVT